MNAQLLTVTCNSVQDNNLAGHVCGDLDITIYFPILSRCQKILFLSFLIKSLHRRVGCVMQQLITSVELCNNADAGNLASSFQQESDLCTRQKDRREPARSSDFFWLSFQLFSCFFERSVKKNQKNLNGLFCFSF